MTDHIKPLIIQQYVKMANKKGIISFAAGLPDLSVLPQQQLNAAFAEIGHLSSFSFQYQPPLEALKVHIQQLMAKLSLSCNLDEILLTNGAQQGIFLTTQLLFKQSASLMVEKFVYPGFQQLTHLFQLNYLSLSPHRTEGLDFNQMESILKTKNPLPYFYLVSNGHNPLGTTLDENARKNLAFLADKYQFIIVEDDPYGFLNLSEQKYPSMRAYTNNAIYIGSFSKIIAPALRTGWLVADPEQIKKLQQLKDMNDLYNTNPNHLVLNHLLNTYTVEEITSSQKTLYKNKLHCMISSLEKYLKVPFRYKKPLHGMFLWLEFPDEKGELPHMQLLEESKVLYVPSSAFSTDAFCKEQAIRLNFTFPSFEEIETGIQRLSLCFNERLGIKSYRENRVEA